MMNRCAFVFSLLSLLGSVSHAELKLPAIIGDNMVLQSNQADLIWGWDTPGTEVKVQWEKQDLSTKADANGRWEVSLHVGEASAVPSVIHIQGSSKREIKNVLVGEVWMCSGQSNMRWSLSDTHDADLEIMTAKRPLIRLISVPNVGTQEPRKDFEGAWKECSPESAPIFSAVGYHYGRILHEALGVPVGLINNAWGGSACEAWVRRDVLENDPRFKRAVEANAKAEAANLAPAATVEHEKRLAEWRSRAAAAKKAGKPFTQKAPPSPKDWLEGKQRIGNIFNGVLLPTVGYGMKGVIWYQGESNTTRAHDYTMLFPRMIKLWREIWQQGEFPFYWVQLADFKAEKPVANESVQSDWAELREAQTQTMSALRFTGQAVILDLGEDKDIHPMNKRDVAERLARWALAKDYGFHKMPHRSAELKEVKFEGEKAVVTLNTFNAGPLKTFDVPEVKGFTLCGEDKVWHWATGKITTENQVVVTSPQVAKPIAVRYAWADNPKVNLYTAGQSLTVTPFRSDSFDWITKPKE
jgi:sialate O-acetylesterase